MAKRKSVSVTAENTSKRVREQQMGFGTLNSDALVLFVEELRRRSIAKDDDIFLDIGAGCGNILDVVDSYFQSVWGVEMNTEWVDKTPPKWVTSILWCCLESVPTDSHTLMNTTTIAYMYDLCLKRLSRRAKSISDDPHWSIQNVLLDPVKMPSLRYFISTYEEGVMFSLHGMCWKKVYQQKLACSTNSYMFYVYERCANITPSAVSSLTSCQKHIGNY